MDTSAPNVSTPVTPAAAVADPLDQLLRLIIEGYFVLTDGQGALSKWSDPAELLFDMPADEALGEPLFGRLVDPTALGPDAQAWREFLELGDVPGARGRLDLTANKPGGGTFPMEAFFVPVKLDEGFDFSLFLEDLAFELPIEMMLLRMRQQHPVVIKALRASLAAEQQPWEGWRTAGVLVAFRPLVDTPWMAEAMARREAEAALAAEELQDRIAMYEAPGVQGDDVYDLEDARAVIDRLRWATARIEDLEERSRIAEGAAQQAANAQVRAEAAERAAMDARAEFAGAMAERPAEDPGQAERIAARLEALEQAVETAEQARRDAGEIALVEARAAVERAREELAERLTALEQDRGAGEQARAQALAGVRAELEALRDNAPAAPDLGPIYEQLEALRENAPAEPDLGPIHEQLKALRENAPAAPDLGPIHEQLDALRGRAEGATDGVDAVRREQQQLRAWLEDARRERDEARQEVRDALRSAEEARAALEREARELPQRQAAESAAASDAEVNGLIEGTRMELRALAEQAEIARSHVDEVREEAREAQRTAREATERIDLVDRGAANVLNEVKTTRTAADEAAAAARAAQDEAAQGRDEVEGLRNDLEDVRTGYGARLEGLEQAPAAVPDGLDERMDRLHDGVTAAMARLEGLAVELASARDESASRIDLEERLAGAADQLQTVREDAVQARDGLDGLRSELAELRAEAAAAREAAEAAETAAAVGAADQSAVEALRAELHEALSTMQALREGADEARLAAVAARRDAEAARQAAESAGVSNASETFAEMWKQMARGAPAQAGAEAPAARPERRVAGPRRPAPPEREPREGFDDQARPMALLDLKGRFTQLNPAFQKLVGYREHEFGKATWPSVLDRSTYHSQSEELVAMLAGEQETAEVCSTYMHGQGLMVLVVGEVQVQRAEDGTPEALLLVADPGGPAGA